MPWRVDGQVLPPATTALIVRSSSKGLPNSPVRLNCSAWCKNAQGSGTSAARSCKTARMSSDDKASRCSTVTCAPGATRASACRSLCPSQSASRHDSRNRGRPARASQARMASNGTRPSLAPARTSSRASMKTVWPCTAVDAMLATMSRAAISRPLQAVASVSKLHDLPAPGSPSKT